MSGVSTFWQQLFAKLKANLAGRVYLVGGPARDYLLNRPCKDFDFLIEGDSEAYAQAAETLRKIFPPAPSSERHYGEFETRHWRTTRGLDIDCARPRTEIYSHSGALPKITLALTAQQDLGRRDFSINAIALGISRPIAGLWLDPFDGRRDLKKKQIRVLHEKSFEDDPTRMLRALRFKTRLGFALERNTQKFLKEGVRGKYIDNVSWERCCNELLYGCAETGWLKTLGVFLRTGFFRDILPSQTERLPRVLANHLNSQAPQLRLMAAYAWSLFQGKTWPRQRPLSSYAWPEKEWQRSIQDIEMLAFERWRPSRRPSALTLKVLGLAHPRLEKVFRRRRPFFIAKGDWERFRIEPLQRKNIYDGLAKRVLRGAIKTQRQALAFLRQQAELAAPGASLPGGQGPLERQRRVGPGALRRQQAKS